MFRVSWPSSLTSPRSPAPPPELAGRRAMRACGHGPDLAAQGRCGLGLLGRRGSEVASGPPVSHCG
jgi:hypothetical protein